MGRPALPAAAALLVALAVATSMCIDSQGGGHLVGKDAPDFTVLDVDGRPHNLTDYRGSVLVIDFFATWCGPCHQQLEELEGLWREVDRSEVHFIMIDVDVDEGEGTVRTYRDDQGIEWPVAAGGDAVRLDYGVEAIPTSLIVDQDGVVRYHHEGLSSESDLREIIDELLSP